MLMRSQSFNHGRDKSGVKSFVISNKAGLIKFQTSEIMSYDQT